MEGESLPGSVLLRGPSIGITVILRPTIYLKEARRELCIINSLGKGASCVELQARMIKGGPRGQSAGSDIVMSSFLPIFTRKGAEETVDRKSVV